MPCMPQTVYKGTTAAITCITRWRAAAYIPGRFTWQSAIIPMAPFNITALYAILTAAQ